MTFYNKFIVVVICFFWWMFFSALSKTEETQIKTPNKYYLDGLYYYVDRSNTSATEQFEALSKNYPYSNYTRNSLIMEAFTNYADKEYGKISGITEVYFRLFPNDAYASYMAYINAMSYYATIKNAENSLDNIEKSYELFLDVKNNFSNTKYAEDAKIKLEYLSKMMQLNDIKIGDFYFSRGDYIGAMRKYTGMFKKYKEKLLPEIEERALCGCKTCSQTLNLDKLADDYLNKLKRNFPHSKCVSSVTQNIGCLSPYAKSNKVRAVK